MAYVPDPTAVLCYDCGAFHATCKSVTVVELSSSPYLWCPDCRCLAHLDLVATRITVESAKKERS